MHFFNQRIFKVKQNVGWLAWFSILYLHKILDGRYVALFKMFFQIKQRLFNLLKMSYLTSLLQFIYIARSFISSELMFTVIFYYGILTHKKSIFQKRRIYFFIGKKRSILHTYLDLATILIMYLFQFNFMKSK